MSQPAAPPPPEPVPAPAVPYGPGPDAPTEATPFSAETAAKSVGRTAASWGLRFILVLVLRAIFRALARR